MAYDQTHYEIMAASLGVQDGLSERRMFGGLCFMLHGNMLCGVHKGGGMARVGKDREVEALALPGVTPLSFTGRRMGGMVDLGEETFDDPAALNAVLGLALDFVRELPPK